MNYEWLVFITLLSRLIGLGGISEVVVIHMSKVTIQEELHQYVISLSLINLKLIEVMAILLVGKVFFTAC